MAFGFYTKDFGSMKTNRLKLTFSLCSGWYSTCSEHYLDSFYLFVTMVLYLKSVMLASGR